MTEHNQPLEKSLRKNLEAAVKKARDIAEAAAEAALDQLEVGAAKTESLTEESDKDLRRRLRIHGRQLGDRRNASTQTQETERLREEIAYQHWHRMLFARFLAENGLLMYPDLDDPVAVTLADCEDLVDEISELMPQLFPDAPKNGWEVAANFAARMLPQIFRVDSPVFEVTLPTEKQHELEKLLSGLPTEVFSASDSLGWVYQFWQADSKKRINESEVKIGARELPAVTQLFTEPYMVSFLLDNSLGAWWAARRLTDEDLQTANSEKELREKAALPGVPLEYLRFVRTPSGEEGEGEENTGPWTPAAGTFDAWPESLSELKTLDPCCGSGHFLVAALLMLAPMRMELEGLTASEAVDRVLSENLHGLEIDLRCVELAAFALALAAWRFPEAGDYRVLPDLNVACCGLSVSVTKEDWKKLAGDNNQLRIALDWMYDEFKDAPVLGSLLNPAKNMASRVVDCATLAPNIDEALASEEADGSSTAAGVVAHGLLRASTLLASKYDWIITNVPYKKAAELDDVLCEHIETNFEDGRKALETAFILRCNDFLHEQGVLSAVTPQNWTFLTTYEPFRKATLKRFKINHVARLGAGAFQEITGEVVKAILFSSRKVAAEAATEFFSVDVAETKDVTAKAAGIATGEIRFHNQLSQLQNPDARIVLDEGSGFELLRENAGSYVGLQNGDTPRFIIDFWELTGRGGVWNLFQMPCESITHYDGRTSLLRWEHGEGELSVSPQARIQGIEAWNRRGVAIRLTKPCPCVLYDGAIYDQSSAAIIPKGELSLPALWAYCCSEDFRDELEKIDQKRNVTNATFVKVPIDLAHWRHVAAEKYPHGLPEPYSDDPTQWIFHGHPASSTDALQVAVARLLGYRWPTELNAEMELATDARDWTNRISGLSDLADDDGIVCIPAIGNEKAADDRLLNVLHRVFEDGRMQEKIFQEKLDTGDENDPVTVDLWRRDWQPSLASDFNSWLAGLLKDASHEGKTLESWLRDKFFAQHCKVFHNRPFIWHIWDGEKDGFSALVNYHKLDNKLLGKLIHTHLNKWIGKQEKSYEDGHEQRLTAAKSLKLKLEKILEGESPNDIFVRWKSLADQPIGWNPDLNDGVRLNIRPFLTVGDVGKRDAGVLRDKPNIKWTKDRGKDVESAPWYTLGPTYGGKEGDRINDHHLALAEKQAAQNGS